MKRREFITLLGGAAAAWPLAARAQQPERIRQIGVLMGYAKGDPEGQSALDVLRRGLRDLGWTENRNVQIYDRWASGNVERTRDFAAELVGLSPDVIFAYFNAQVAALSRETRTIPIVFVGASDPIGAGYVATLARPGGNITGFTLYEPSIAGKWVGILKEIDPRIARVALMVNPETAVLHGSLYSSTFAAAASSLSVEPVTAMVHTPADIETAISSLSRQPGSGLIVAPDTFTVTNGELIVSLTAKHHLPAVYGFNVFSKTGALLSYGPDYHDAVRRAASYVDRILRGEKAAELPVQAPIKFKTILNVQTAKALGLTVPPGVLVAADEVIE